MSNQTQPNALFDEDKPLARRTSYVMNIVKNGEEKKEQLRRLKEDWFLIDRAAEDLAHRLNAVNREFKSAVFYGDIGSFLIFSSYLKSQNISNWRLVSYTKKRQRKIVKDAREICSAQFRDIDVDTDIEIDDENDCDPEKRSMDLIISLFHMQWVNKVPEFLRRSQNILEPDGLFLAAFPGENSLTAFRHALSAAELNNSDGTTMRVNPMINIGSAGKLLQKAGFAMPVVDVDHVALIYRSINKLRADLKVMGENSSFLAKKSSLTRQIWRECAQRLMAKSRNSKVHVDFDLLHLSGWAPDASQPQPLKPGSGQVSLKSFLSRPPGRVSGSSAHRCD